MQELFEPCRLGECVSSSYTPTAKSLHTRDLPPLKGQRPQKSLMLDEDGKLKYPPKLRRVEVKKTDIIQTKELPTPGIVKLRVS